ncbi:MAG TPA: acyl-CoA dehydrogenase family protein [Thermoanaerobaculia bacterium]|nr:acyl-CoA dehydrogenase family protein [Thermoanaerobaculia bacterium]
MDFATTDDQRMIRGAVEKLTQRFPRSYWLSKAAKTEGPHELWDALASAGFLGTLVPEAYGGAGLGMLEMETLLEALGERGLPLLFLVVSSVMGTLALVKHGSEEQKKRFLPDLVNGKTKFCFAITEPDAGSNSFRITTRAVRDGGDYVVNGRKTFISGADQADHVLLVVRTTPYDDPSLADKRGGMSLLAVPLKSKGIELRKIDVMIEGPESQFLVFLDDVRVPAENLIGTEGRGASEMFDVLNAERISGAAIGVGLGRFVLSKAVSYAKERTVFGSPIGAHQGLQHPMAKVKARLEMAALMAQKAAWLFDAGKNAGAEANIAKLEAAEAAIEACDVAIEVHGGNGFSREFDVITVWPWARLLRTAPVSREMILNYIGEHVLGLPRSYGA